MNELKLFTLHEANALLPRLTLLLNELKNLREYILKQEVEIDAIELVSKPAGKEVPASLARAIEGYNDHVKKFYARIDQVHGLGCFLKDPEHGLVDFYGRYRGEIVYLCWKLGETEITAWHEIGKGFIHRKPLAGGTDDENTN